MMTEVVNIVRENTDAQKLSICRQHAVFQHFPLQALIDNPAVWNLACYKHGCLIEKDSNNTEWIYIVKSGEARVLKRLTPEQVDVKARRKKIMAILEAESPCRQKQKLLNFMSDQKLAVSVYNRKIYHPGARGISAPPGGLRQRTRNDQSILFRSLPTSPIEKYHNNHNHRRTRIFISEQPDKTEFSCTTKLPYIRTPVGHKVYEPQPIPNNRLRTTVEFTSSRDSIPCREKSKSPEVANRYESVPPFVRVESLHPGDAFGFRSCLEPSERGPPVSLVSADCEVIRINKRFFTKQADDAVFSLIRLKAKQFPTQEECVDRLDANSRWAEYKHRVIADYVTNRKKSRR